MFVLHTRLVPIILVIWMTTSAPTGWGWLLFHNYCVTNFLTSIFLEHAETAAQDYDHYFQSQYWYDRQYYQRCVIWCYWSCFRQTSLKYFKIFNIQCMGEYILDTSNFSFKFSCKTHYLSLKNCENSKYSWISHLNWNNFWSEYTSLNKWVCYAWKLCKVYYLWKG